MSFNTGYENTTFTNADITVTLEGMNFRKECRIMITASAK